jgi:hypothetical protein
MLYEQFCTKAEDSLEREHLRIAEDLGFQGKMLKAADSGQVESKVLGKSHQWYWLVSRLDGEGNVHHAIVTDAAATAATADLFSQAAKRLAGDDPKAAEFAEGIARRLREEG